MTTWYKNTEHVIPRWKLVRPTNYIVSINGCLHYGFFPFASFRRNTLKDIAEYQGGP